jgi:hypothetical protein
MKRQYYLSTLIILCFVFSSGVLLAQVDPAGTGTSTSSTQGTTQPTATTGTDASADPNQTPTDTTDTTTSTTDTTSSSSVVPEPSAWHLHIPGVALETEGWLLPLVAFVVSLLLAGILHWALVAHDVGKWPNTGGSWWKLRLLPFLLAAAILVGSYFAFIHGLEEESLRIAGSRARLWLYIYGLAVFVLWLLLPRPKVPTHTKVTVEGKVA